MEKKIEDSIDTFRSLMSGADSQYIVACRQNNFNGMAYYLGQKEGFELALKELNRLADCVGV